MGNSAHDVLLGRDHPVVKAWITGRSILYQANSSPRALVAITMAQARCWKRKKKKIFYLMLEVELAQSNCQSLVASNLKKAWLLLTTPCIIKISLVLR